MSKTEAEARIKAIVNAYYKALESYEVKMKYQVHTKIDDTFTLWRTKTLWFIKNTITDELSNVKIGYNELGRVISAYLSKFE